MSSSPLSADRRAILAGILASGAVLAPARAAWAAAGAQSDYDLARELYRYAFPLIFFGRYRHGSLSGVNNITGQRMAVNQWSHSARTVTPESTGAPQTDTLYSFVLGDLSQAPLLLKIPRMDGRYWSIQCCDFFGQTFAMINRRNTTGPATVALVGPHWRGKTPPGVTAVYRSAMPWTFIALRVHFTSDADRETMIALRAGFGAASAAGRAGTGIVPLARSADPLADFKLLAAMWRDCPPPASDNAYLKRFASLGFGAGARPDIDSLSSARKAALAKAEADGFAEVVAATKSVPLGLTSNGWTRPNPEIGLYRDRNYLFRAVVAQQGIIGTPVSENVYMVLQRLSDGSRLNGNDRFEIVFDPASLGDVGAFWSIHAYRLATFSVIPNPIDRYSISSRSKDLKLNPDGSLTVYAQSSDPGGDRTSNWLPTRAGEEFMLMTRAYEPKGAIAELTWPGPQVRRIPAGG